MTNNQTGDARFIELVRQEQKCYDGIYTGNKPMVMIPKDSSYESPQLNIPFSPAIPIVRPWGQYWDLHRTQDTVVKRLVIYEGHRFSYQYHNDRDEVWMITYGKGQLWLNDTVKVVEPGFSVFIKRGDKHRLANIGEGDLVFFEIQYGNCSEEDIVRLADDYART